ncbi:MAG: hypothetical protein ACI3Z0_10790 [Candidatus Cryptobacteroides sp.]
MKNLEKFFKWLMVGLIVISVGILVWGFVEGYPDTPSQPSSTVEALLYWAYAMVGLALVSVVVFGLVIAAINDPKSLLKLGIGIVVVAAVCGVAYLLAPANPAMGLLQQPSTGTLKLTDTILNLTYLTGGLAILSIIFAEIWSAIRSK